MRKAKVWRFVNTVLGRRSAGPVAAVKDNANKLRRTQEGCAEAFNERRTDLFFDPGEEGESGSLDPSWVLPGVLPDYTGKLINAATSICSPSP